MTYTIKEIAGLAGVTTRTIRYYDEIGLLSPADTGGNGYRYYDQGSLLQLQQILFFRELDVPLKDIQLFMSRPDFNLLGALERLMPFPEAAKILRDRMKSDPTEKTFWGAFNCAKFTDDPEGKKIMKELTSAPFTRIAQRAREELSA